MNPFNIHLKHYIIPSGIVLVSVWTLYLGAVALFQPLKISPDETGDIRPSRTSHHDRADQPSRQHANESEGKKKGQVRVDSGGRSEKKLPANKKKLNETIWAKILKGTVHPNRGQKIQKADLQAAGYKKIASHSTDPRVILKGDIMAEAFSLAMKSEKPWQNLMEVAKVQYSGGEKEAARDILLMAEKMAADPDDQTKASSSVREVVKVMLSQQLNEDALAALQNIQNARERERAISEIAAWSARQGRVDLARNLISQIVNASSRDVVLVAIAESEATYEGASAAMQTVGSIHNPRKKDDAYCRIAIKRGILNDFSWADQAVQLVQNDKLKNATLASLARQRVKNGDSAGGLNTLQHVNDPEMADSALRELSGDLARLGKFSTSAYVTTRIRSDAEKSNALELLSIEQAKKGDLRASLVRTSGISVKSVRERALRSVSAVTADNGEPGRARNVAVRINSSRERNRAYRAIAQASAADGNHVSAYNTLQEIDRPDEKALALVSMARTRQKQGDTRQALSMLEDASRTAHDVTSGTSLDNIQSGLAVAYAERSESSHSLKLAEQIKNVRRRDSTYGSLARTLIGKHDIHAAQQSVKAIASDKLRLRAEDDIARTLARQVKPKNALKRVRVLHSTRQRIIFLLEISRKI